MEQKNKCSKSKLAQFYCRINKYGHYVAWLNISVSNYGYFIIRNQENDGSNCVCNEADFTWLTRMSLFFAKSLARERRNGTTSWTGFRGLDKLVVSMDVD